MSRLRRMRYGVVASDLDLQFSAKELTGLRQCDHCGRVTAYRGAQSQGHYRYDIAEQDLCRKDLHPVTDKALLTAFTLGGHAAVEAILRARDP